MTPRSRRADPVEVTLRGSLAVVAVAASATATLPAGAGAGEQGCGAGSYGSPGYAYAGHQASGLGSGVRATIAPLRRPAVVAGHVAAWVGVGGPGQGANGASQWLQVGIAALPGTAPMLYVEITRARSSPQFVPLQEVRVGERHTLEVRELPGRPGWWSASVDGRAVIRPVHLPGSSGRWRPIATAESWNGGRAVCNGFSFRFEGVQVAGSAGSWQAFAPGARFQDRGLALRELPGASRTRRTLAAGGPAPYAFDASASSATSTA